MAAPIKQALSSMGDGNFVKAESLLKKILKGQPNNIEALYLAGISTMRLKKYHKSELLFTKALKIKSDFSSAINGRAILYHELERFEEAVNDCKIAISIDPNYAEAFYNMGRSLNALGLYAEASESYAKAVSCNPNYIKAMNNHGVVLCKLGRFDEAIDAYSKAILIKPDFAGALVNRGVALREMNRFDEAIRDYNTSMSLQPNNAEARFNRGNLNVDLKRFEDAAADYVTAINLKPNYADAYYQMSLIKKFKKNDPQIYEMKKLIKGNNLTLDEKCKIMYALAKASEDHGDLDNAFSQFKEAGALRKKILKYDFSKDVTLFKKIETSAKQMRQINLKPRSGDKKFIFILGMPRSGTSLVEQIISSHSRVFGGGELPFVELHGTKIISGSLEANTENIELFRAAYLAEIEKIAPNHDVVTDKMPHNFRFIALILAAFPESKIIHTQRDASATCWSNFKTYFPTADLGYSYDLKDTVKFFKLYTGLMKYWSEIHGDSVYNLNYEKLTENPKQEIKSLIKKIGLNWEDACLKPHENSRLVKTASQFQVMKNIYKGSSKTWQKFEFLLADLFYEFKENGYENDK